MSPSVLVVEDYSDLCDAIVETLARNHYNCDSAVTAEDAIRKLRTHRYETILLSPRLPILNDPVMTFLHEMQPEELAHVVLMTDPESDSENPDACRILCKPFNNEELLAKLV